MVSFKTFEINSRGNLREKWWKEASLIFLRVNQLWMVSMESLESLLFNGVVGNSDFPGTVYAN